MQKTVIESFAPDLLQSFLIDRTHIGGRLVRLGTVANTILLRNEYPDAVSRLLAEMLVIASMLSYSLKSQGILTLQATGDGPVQFIVVDVTENGNLRGYAELAEDAAEELDALSPEESDELMLGELLGNGKLAIILDQGADGGRYQGIVELKGNSLSEAIQHYFTQSQQAEMAVKLAVHKDRKSGRDAWSAAGIMIERLPEEGGKQEPGEAESMIDAQEAEEEWQRNRLFMSTVRDEELLNQQLSSWKLLTRLFNEDGVWAYAPHALSAECRCSRGRILEVLSTINYEELQEMMDDGALSVHCRFCNTTEVFTEEALSHMHETKH